MKVLTVAGFIMVAACGGEDSKLIMPDAAPMSDAAVPMDTVRVSPSGNDAADGIVAPSRRSRVRSRSQRAMAPSK